MFRVPSDLDAVLRHLKGSIEVRGLAAVLHAEHRSLNLEPLAQFVV